MIYLYETARNSQQSTALIINHEEHSLLHKVKHCFFKRMLRSDSIYDKDLLL